MTSPKLFNSSDAEEIPVVKADVQGSEQYRTVDAPLMHRIDENEELASEDANPGVSPQEEYVD